MCPFAGPIGVIPMRHSDIIHLLGGLTAGLIVGMGAAALQLAPNPHSPVVTGITYTYPTLKQAQEVSTHYYCTDIIGDDGQYVVEGLANEECD